MEVRWRYVGVDHGGIKLWSSGGALQCSAVEDGGMEQWETLQACKRRRIEVCRCSDVKT